MKGRSVCSVLKRRTDIPALIEIHGRTTVGLRRELASVGVSTLRRQKENDTVYARLTLLCVSFMHCGTWVHIPLRMLFKPCARTTTQLSLLRANKVEFSVDREAGTVTFVTRDGESNLRYDKSRTKRIAVPARTVSFHCIQQDPWSFEVIALSE